MANLAINTADWDKYAKTFATLLEKGPAIAPAEAMLEELNSLSPFSAAGTILDVGCGPGQVTNMLLKNYSTVLPPETSVIASDTSTASLGEVKNRKAQMLQNDPNNSWSKVETQTLDVQDMSTIQSSSISHVTAGFVFFMVPRAQDALKEVLRVLKPDGGFALSSWHGTDWMHMVTFLKQVRPDETLPSIDPLWTTVEGIQEKLETAGFQKINVHYTPTFWEYESAEAATKMVKMFPPVQMATKTWSAEELEKFSSLCVAFLEDKYGSGPGKMEGTAVMGICKK